MGGSDPVYLGGDLSGLRRHQLHRPGVSGGSAHHDPGSAHFLCRQSACVRHQLSASGAGKRDSPGSTRLEVFHSGLFRLRGRFDAGGLYAVSPPSGEGPAGRHRHSCGTVSPDCHYGDRRIICRLCHYQHLADH
ncbi:hypothetical protein D3C75_996860 [compost metagenome]